MMYARSQMPSVSRTLWSVIRTPIPRSLRKPMIFWMSSTAIGSMPAKGSSSRMNRGRVASARAISTRRRSPPERLIAGASREVRDRQVLEQRVETIGDLVAVDALQLEDGLHVLGDGQLAEYRRFLRQVRQAQARAQVDRHARDRSSPSSSMRPAVGRDKADDHVEAGRLARAVGPEQADHFAASHRSETSCTTMRDL